MGIEKIGNLFLDGFKKLPKSSKAGAAFALGTSIFTLGVACGTKLARGTVVRNSNVGTNTGTNPNNVDINAGINAANNEQINLHPDNGINKADSMINNAEDYSEAYAEPYYPNKDDAKSEDVQINNARNEDNHIRYVVEDDLVGYSDPSIPAKADPDLHMN